ncbi:rubredoxin [Trifolium pratense]|uniref:Rubredoxin n=3 Tax=Trifolium pratense TaxID=57577 RepID=A0A2K3LH61_TRIPR|nr:uncharacterized protein LOC123917962 [Trifolium pratense]PNX77868.1 rubredoxin [Trifolium pratense]
MALQVQATLHTTRSSLPSLSSPRPSSNQFALKSSFFSRSLNLVQQQSLVHGPPKYTMRVASKQAYICRDCGYIYNDKTPFDKLPDKYFCPVCGAPKRRFKPYATDVNKKANETDVRKARKAELQRDEAVGKALPIAVAVGVVALAGLYFYLNNTF